MGWEQEGQFSGEISPVMLKEVGMELVMIGHSERRHVLGETDEMENKKVLCALRNGLTPLLCIGETGEQKALGLSDEVLRTQIKIGLHGVRAEDAAKVWIAYEPVWAIGVNGVPATKEYAEEKHGVMRATLNELYGLPANETAPLIDHSQVPALASYTRFPQILRREDYLHDVLLVQKRLSELGYLDENYNGYYGKDTEKAVRAFQQDNGLQADGLCGQATWNALFGGS